ncbi:tetratricopeptide repeat protein [Dactylosporangium sp. McL0621]|uniref:tetratricopeptide repeat protein n=1 Tax=Dactylosporangium sp. McL0621 TaxID=3415678 RepID=UPI003CE7205D
MQGDGSSPTDLIVSTIFAVFSGERFAGTGFFVGPGLGLTCAHVVSGSGPLRIRYRDADLPAVVVSVHPPQPGDRRLYPLPDLAFLEIDAGPAHPTVLLSPRSPQPGGRLYSLGFAISDAPGGDGPRLEGLLVEVAGPAGEAVRVRGDQIVPGLSGSPMLDLDEGRVCAVLKTSRNVREVHGGWAVPVDLAEACRPGLRAANLRHHPPGTAWREVADGRAEATRMVFATRRPNEPPPRPADPPPSWWLNPRNRAVAYLRPERYDDLLGWCRRRAPGYLVRLVVAGGGTGKTRLALELREALAAEGWIAGLVSLPADVQRIAARLPEAAERHRVMVAVDYAETLGAEIGGLVHAVEGCPAGSVRILLLARAVGPWWQQLLWPWASQPLIDPDAVLLDEIGADQRIAVAEAAYRTFRAEVPGADRDAPPQLPPALRHLAESQVRPLDLHSIALLGVLGGDATDPLHGVLGHELHYAERALAARAEVPAGANDDVVERLALVPTLAAAPDRPTAVAVVQRLADPLRRKFAAPESVAVTLANLYPADNSGAFWGQLRPDRLAERLLQDVAKGFGSTRPTCDYLLAALGPESPSGAFAAIALIFRAATAQDRVEEGLLGVLRQLADDDPPNIAPALLVTSTTEASGSRLLGLLRDGLPRWDRSTVQALNDHLPANFLDFAHYARFGLAVLRRLDALLADDDGVAADHRRAENSLELGRALRRTGSVSESIEWYRRARDTFRAAATTEPAAYVGRWAAAVTGIGLAYFGWHRYDLAEEALVEAVEVWRRDVAIRAVPDAHDGLATALGNLAQALLAQRRDAAAAELAREAVRIRRMLVAQDPARQAGLVNSLTTLGEVLIARNRYEEAADLAREAVNGVVRSGSMNNTVVAERAAAAWSCLGVCLARMGDVEAAIPLLTQAAELQLQLAGHRADTSVEDVTATLFALTGVFADGDQYGEARRWMQQLHRLLQVAASGNLALLPLYAHVVGRYAELLLLEGDDLGEALRLSAWAFERRDARIGQHGRDSRETPVYLALVHAKVLQAVSQLPAAHAAAEEAVTRCRLLVSSFDGAFHSMLAQALVTQHNIDDALGNHEAALRAGIEAVAIWEQLVAEGAEPFGVELAGALALVGTDLLNLGRRADAAAAAIQCRGLAAGRTGPRWREAMAAACRVQMMAMKDSDPASAVSAGRRAVRMFRELNDERPKRYGPSLAEAWTDLGFAYSAAGHPAEALQASIDAVDAIESYIGEGGLDGERVYAKCLRNLGWDLHHAGRPAEAARCSRQAIAVLETLPSQQRTDLLEIRGTASNLVDQCLAMGDYEGAGAAQRLVARIDDFLGRPDDFLGRP